MQKIDTILIRLKNSTNIIENQEVNRMKIRWWEQFIDNNTDAALIEG